MTTPILDFSHLTPDERIELAGQLWDSLAPEVVSPDEELAAELRRRRAELAADGDLGEPWRAVLDGIRRSRGVTVVAVLPGRRHPRRWQSRR